MVWSFLKFEDRSIEQCKELKMSLFRLIPHFVQMRHKCKLVNFRSVVNKKSSFKDTLQSIQCQDARSKTNKKNINKKHLV